MIPGSPATISRQTVSCVRPAEPWGRPAFSRGDARGHISPLHLHFHRSPAGETQVHFREVAELCAALHHPHPVALLGGGVPMVVAPQHHVQPQHAGGHADVLRQLHVGQRHHRVTVFLVSEVGGQSAADLHRVAVGEAVLSYGHLEKSW